MLPAFICTNPLVRILPETAAGPPGVPCCCGGRKQEILVVKQAGQTGVYLGDYRPALCLFGACALRGNPRGRLMPSPHRGRGWAGCFGSLRAESSLITKTFETEWYLRRNQTEEVINQTTFRCPPAAIAATTLKTPPLTTPQSSSLPPRHLLCCPPRRRGR